jgi:FlaA1/EpsC-like NDP-sugar epimerase
MSLMNTNEWHARFLSMPRSTKRVVMVLADMAALSVALWSAFALRLSDWWPSSYLADAWTLFIATPVVGVAIFIKLGLYRAVVRYMNVKLFQTVAIGVLLLVGVLYSAAITFDIWRVPRSVPIIFGLSAWLYLGGSRLIVRSYYHWLVNRTFSRERVLIYGAGAAGAQLAIMLNGGMDYQPVAFIDDDKSLKKGSVAGYKVYPTSDLADLAERLRIDHILLAIPSASPEQRKRVLEKLSALHISIKTMPSMLEMIEGESPDVLREIEVDDLLGREMVSPNTDLIAQSIKGKRVCVTGAGGSIGSELCRQALQHGASMIVLYELSEFALYSIEQELAELKSKQGYDAEIIPIIGSVQVKERLEMVLKRFQIQTVYHAAAYKHVPLVEHNVLQGLANNSLGTIKAAEAAEAASVERFVLISTDKAVRPTNVMGATKRFAELCVQDIASRTQSQTIFSMVRFGNVLGSSGSVVPLFRKQIKEGGPITVTHPEINRYFMTIPEAASLVIQAGSMASGGEVFVLDMGEPVKIANLAENMINLSGLTVKSVDNLKGDIEVVFTGLRPGEKLYEELLIGDDVIPTSHEKIMCAREEVLTSSAIQQLLSEADEAIKSDDSDRAREILKVAVSGFNPSSGNVDWMRHSSNENRENLH